MAKKQREIHRFNGPLLISAPCNLFLRGLYARMKTLLGQEDWIKLKDAHRLNLGKAEEIEPDFSFRFHYHRPRSRHGWRFCKTRMSSVRRTPCLSRVSVLFASGATISRFFGVRIGFTNLLRLIFFHNFHSMTFTAAIASFFWSLAKYRKCRILEYVRRKGGVVTVIHRLARRI